MQRLFVLLISLICAVLSSHSQVKNVLIHTQQKGEYAPCEPSISVDESNPSRVMAGSVLNNYYTSSDSGLTWTKNKLESKLGVYGDPCVVAGKKGRFHYFHLSNPSGEGWSNPDILDRIVGQTTRSFGKRWSKGSSIGLNHPKDQDKEWAIYDPINDLMHIAWTQFDLYGSKNPSDKSNILYAFSKNGKRWSEAVQLNQTAGNCIDNSGTAEGAVPAVGVDGAVYVAWALDEHIYFSKVAGESWGKKRLKQAPGAEQKAVEGGVSWAYGIPGLNRCNGLPIIDTDRSNGPYRGDIYINWTDQRKGADNTEVWIVKSTDSGATWTHPSRVNDDEGNAHQFMSWMDVDPITGYIYIIYYDRRNDRGNGETDVYLATSKNGGEDFINEKISERPFTPDPDLFFGDYTNISAFGGIVRPVWTRIDQGKLSIWTAIINRQKD